MPNPLLLVDLQHGFINEYTHHIPNRVVSLIDRGEYDPILATKFINIEGGPFHRFIGWHDCTLPPETDLVEEIVPYVAEEMVFSKPGSAGISDELASYLREHEIARITIVGIDTDMCVLKVSLDVFDLGIEPIILTDCCASTAGLQSHLAGLAVLARNIGADHLRDAGLGGDSLAAPVPNEAATTR
ncbi:MAG TPA: isochorismatase family cysteine hydrolase [Thermomicrobiales bacterium]|nr:isochorismatase family cysteine hydrolase [Thermomicrobiales bacterium]